jgi:hypothetical protein
LIPSASLARQSDAVTTPGQPQPWQQPGAPQPAPKRKLAGIIALLVGGSLALCCGGVAAVGGVFGDDPQTATKDAAVEQTEAPRLVAPITTTASPSLTPTTKAAPSSKPKPAVSKKATPNPRPTTKKPRPRPTTKKPQNVYYANCTAVRAAGADPIRSGDPGYSRKLDRDGDGVACE